MTLKRWPIWRRLARAMVMGLVLVGLVWLTRGWWRPVGLQWQYWRAQARQEQQAGVKATSYQNHPLALALPAEAKLLESGGWATERTKKIAEMLKAKYPLDAGALDYYLACWEFWAGDPYAARTKLATLNRPVDPVTFALRVDDWAALRKLADDPSVATHSRARAWLELARRAEGVGQRKESGVAYLRALENAVSSEQSHPAVDPAWEAVRRRLGTEITLADYHAALLRMVHRTKDQAWLEQIMFELGKLKILTEQSARKEAHS